MTVYPNFPISAQAAWPQPAETIWQALPTPRQASATWKRPDLGLSDRLFIGAVVNIPREQRAWGMLNWLSEAYEVSRPTLYAIGEKARAGFLPSPAQTETAAPVSQLEVSQKAVVVTPNRVKRTVMSLILPGGVTERPIGDCLETAFDEGRSAGFVSKLLHEAGQKAGEILAQVDHSVLGAVIQARDELFVGREPILLMVEPKSLVITGLYATADREADTWGCVLLFTQDRRVQIKGLAEDGCIPYDASCRAAQLDAAIQKDVWHPLEEVRKVIRDVEREAFQKMKAADKLEKQLRKTWDEAIFDTWVVQEEQIASLLEQSSRLRFWRDCLWDAVELVDWRSGEIRERAINQWLADETLKGIRQLPHPRIQKLAERLAAQLPEMLTFLETTAQPLAHWQALLQPLFPDQFTATQFQSAVARLWRLEHALRNGQKHFAKAALEAEQWLALWLEEYPQLQPHAEKLLCLLEAVVRTSSAAETINSVLRPYLDRRRECTDLISRQCFLNLFVLWFNMHKFERGPRKGKSPYELAGIDLGTDDWLSLLGFPPDPC
jgi:hypothetical protein